MANAGGPHPQVPPKPDPSLAPGASEGGLDREGRRGSLGAGSADGGFSDGLGDRLPPTTRSSAGTGEGGGPDGMQPRAAAPAPRGKVVAWDILARAA
jgi:hypothetical protein